MASNGVRLELEEASRKNLEKNMDIIKKEYPKKTFEAIIKILFDIKFLAKQKLKAGGHIVTSRLRNSLFVQLSGKNQRLADRRGNSNTYSDENGKSFKSELTSVRLDDNEGAVGTNVEYAGAIEFGAAPHVIRPKTGKALKFKVGGRTIFAKSVNHPGFSGDSFLYWASKHVDVRKRVTELQKELKKIRFVR